MDNLFAKQELSSQDLQLLASEMDKKKKSSTTTWLLWWSTGSLGGHRYYLGKTGSAILMTITLGCLGIWSLIDAFLLSCMIQKTNERIESDIIQQLQLMKNAKGKEKATVSV